MTETEGHEGRKCKCLLTTQQFCDIKRAVQKGPGLYQKCHKCLVSAVSAACTTPFLCETRPIPAQFSRFPLSGPRTSRHKNFVLSGRDLGCWRIFSFWIWKRSRIPNRVRSGISFLMRHFFWFFMFWGVFDFRRDFLLEYSANWVWTESSELFRIIASDRHVSLFHRTQSPATCRLSDNSLPFPLGPLLSFNAHLLAASFLSILSSFFFTTTTFCCHSLSFLYPLLCCLTRKQEEEANDGIYQVLFSECGLRRVPGAYFLTATRQEPGMRCFCDHGICKKFAPPRTKTLSVPSVEWLFRSIF